MLGFGGGDSHRWAMATQVGNENEIAVGQCRVVKHGTVDVAVFHTEEGFFAVENDCPHAYAPLSGGDVKDCVVECPLHGWTFNIKDGSPVEAPSAATIRTFKVEVSDGVVSLAD